MFDITLYTLALQSRGFTDAGITTLPDGKVIAFAIKRGAFAGHMGRDVEDARGRLASLITRPEGRSA